MKTTLLTLAIAAAMVASSASAAERLLPAAAGDLVPTALVASKAAPAAGVERAPVDFAWALDPAAALAAQAPYVAQSREFWSTIGAKRLQAGYTFPTTAPGALVRISPAAGNKSAALRAGDLELRIDGRSVDAATAIRASADAEQLKAAGAEFSDGTLVFQLAHEIGAGAVELRAKAASGQYLMHVFEPNSDVSLTLGADRDRALAGDTLTLNARFEAGKGTVAPDSIGGVVTAPDGRSIDVAFQRAKDGGYRADVTLPADAGNGLALWEVHTFAVAKAGGVAVPRDAKTSFAVSQPTARLAGSASTTQKAGGVTVALPVQAASAGRFELRGVLYGTAKDGSMQPFAVAHAARWLEPGTSDIALKFGSDVMHAGLGAPFELRDLSLNDQARMGLLETRARALRIDATQR